LETEQESKAPRPLLAIIGVALILLLFGIGASLAVPLQPPLGVGAASTNGVASVFMPNDAALVGFSPRNITVVIGVNNTVVWTNKDSTIHTVYSKSIPAGASSFNSAYLSPGDTFQVILNVTGVYDYYCSIHPATMTGSIRVIGSSSSTSTSST